MAAESDVPCCLRCGGDDTSSPGHCCFHPGLVDAPGPLMYSPEWLACRSSCTAQMPGCYVRREHYYTPCVGVKGGPGQAGKQATVSSSRHMHKSWSSAQQSRSQTAAGSTGSAAGSSVHAAAVRQLAVVRGGTETTLVGQPTPRSAPPRPTRVR
jgi:hypothetical protein